MAAVWKFYRPIDPEINPHLYFDMTYLPTKFEVDWCTGYEII